MPETAQSIEGGPFDRLDVACRLVRRAPVDPKTGCWGWSGATLPNGYGTDTFRRRTRYVHRLSFFAFWGDPGRGVVDHLCRNRRCVNPDHLELVTRGENVRRGVATNRGTCKKGIHPWTPDNVYHRNGRPTCKVCAREAAKRRYRNAR